MILSVEQLSIEQYWGWLEPRLPGFAPAEQRAAVVLYRELAKGQPVDVAQFSRALDVSPTEARALLERDCIKGLVYPDERNRVLGFGGLAAAPMHHRFEVDGRSLWTWCAWDSLFIPELLDQAARVTSADPETGEVVRLVVTPHRIDSVAPESAVISFPLPDADAFGTSAANVIAKFCHFVFFFSSRVSGDHFVAKHQGTSLYSLDDAFSLAKRLNARNFGSALAHRAGAAG